MNDAYRSAPWCGSCGETLRSETVMARGLDVCRACLASRGEVLGPRPGLPHTEPAHLVFVQAASMAAATLGGGSLGLGLAFGLGAPLAGGAAVGAVLGLVVFAARLRQLDAWIKVRWKRDVARRLGLVHLPLSRFLFAFRLRTDSPGGKWTAEDLALVIEADDAIVCLGPDGTCVTRFATIVGMQRVGFRGCVWVALRLAGDHVLCLSIQEDATTWGASAAMDAFGLRLSERRARWMVRTAEPNPGDDEPR